MDGWYRRTRGGYGARCVIVDLDGIKKGSEPGSVIVPFMASSGLPRNSRACGSDLNAGTFTGTEEQT